MAVVLVEYGYPTPGRRIGRASSTTMRRERSCIRKKWILFVVSLEELYQSQYWYSLGESY